MKTIHIISAIHKAGTAILLTTFLLPAAAQRTYTLQECRERALQNNVSMTTAQRRMDSAKEQQREAFTRYFPQVSATGLSFRTNRDMLRGEVNTSSLLSDGMLQTLQNVLPAEMMAQIPATIPISLIDRGTLANVSAIQPLFAGGQIVNGNRLARVGVEVSQLQREQSENEVLLTVDQYYWQVVSLIEKRRTLESIQDMLRQLDSDVSVAVKAGVTMRNDLLKVQLRENEVESGLVKVQNGITLSQMLLAQYIGLGDTAIQVAADVDTELLPDYPAQLRQDHQQALLSTPEYRLLGKQVDAAVLNRKMEVGRNLPSVGVGAGYAYNHLLDHNASFGVVFASVSIPLSAWWGGSHAIKRRKITEEDAREQMKDNGEKLVLRMQKQWNDVDDAYKQLSLAHKSIEQSRENLRLNTDFYRAGLVKLSDLLDAQRLYQQSRDEYVDAYSQYQVCTTQYRLSTGQQR